MKIKFKRLNTVEKELEVELSEKEIQPFKNNTYSNWQKKVGIPGYRKGKAPLDLVVGRYSNEINNDLKDNLVSLFYKKALEESKITPISNPLMIESSLTNDGGCVFKLRVEEKPKIKLPKYKNLKLEKKSSAVKDDEILEILENLKKERTQWIDTERESLKGDFLIIDWLISSEGKVVDKKENASLLLDEKNLFPGLLDNLLSLKKDDDKEFELEVPADFSDKKVAGRKCFFKIKVKAVKEKKEPVIDDNFAKDAGKKETLKDLRDTIREELKGYKEAQTEMELEGVMFEKLLAGTDMEIPPQLLDRQAKKAAQDIALRLFYKGVSHEEVEKQADVIWKEAKIEAEKQLKIHFILEEIAEQEEIMVSDEDFQLYLEKLAQKNKLPLDEFKSRLDKEGKLENLREDLRRQKVIEYIKQKAEIVSG